MNGFIPLIDGFKLISNLQDSTCNKHYMSIQFILPLLTERSTLVQHTSKAKLFVPASLLLRTLNAPKR